MGPGTWVVLTAILAGKPLGIVLFSAASKMGALLSVSASILAIAVARLLGVRRMAAARS